jgi:hypothetical protein
MPLPSFVAVHGVRPGEPEGRDDLKLIHASSSRKAGGRRWQERLPPSCALRNVDKALWVRIDNEALDNRNYRLLVEPMAALATKKRT